MTLRQLTARAVGRVWGRPRLPHWAGPGAAGPDPTGEIWFEDERGDEAELLVKYLFTSDRLSIQVHPDDAAARAAGYRRGKDEAWLVLEAEQGAEIGIGLTRRLTADELRAAALDGSIEQLLDRRQVRAGEVFYSPAGTIHAIGPGLALLEIQQNVDLTYRLYDYGRPRELHLDEGVAAANPAPFDGVSEPRELEPGRERIAEGTAFSIERWRGAWSGLLSADRPVLAIPRATGVALGDGGAEPGTVWSVEGEERILLEAGAELLLACPAGAAVSRAPL